VHDPRDHTYFGDNPPSDGEWLTKPVRGTGVINESLPVWQRYANPVWDDVAIPATWGDGWEDVQNYLVEKTKRGEMSLDIDFVTSLIEQAVRRPSADIPTIWSDIIQTDVLNYLVAKEDKDQRHICPLQLPLISRLIHWYTNPGDVVFDPFGGIGSTGVEALRLGRKAKLIELKESYYNLALKYLRATELETGQMTLWDYANQQAGEEVAK
jgi:hypothetical protein